MAGRASTVLLAISGLVVVALGAALFILTRVDTPTTPAPAPRAAAPTEPAATPRPADPSEPAPAPHEPQARTPATVATHASPSGPAPVLTAPPVMVEHDGKRDENGKLVPIVTVAQLKTKLPATDAAIKACADKAKDRATGKATLSFTVASKDGKLIIESTGVDDDGTLAAYPDLLACMQDTAHALSLDDLPVPELGTAIYVRRHVRLDAGAVAENSIFNFSYNAR